MSSQDQIQKQLNDEFEKFMNDSFKQVDKLPENIQSLFKISVMSLAPAAHGVNFNKIKSIAEKKITQLTNGDITAMVKIIINTPIGKLYKDFDTAIVQHLKLEKFIISYNEGMDKFKQQLEMKRVTLTDLAGTNKNGSRIHMVN